jgi:hypothetical protein
MKDPQEDERFEGVDAPGIRAMIKDYKVDMRRSAYIPMLLLLAACGKPSRPRPSLSSPPRQQNTVLIPAAIAAATKWRFAPCRPFGSVPIELKSQSDIQFTLAQ